MFFFWGGALTDTRTHGRTAPEKLGITVKIALISLFALGSYWYFRFGSICTSSLHLTLFSEVGRRRFERSQIWNSQKHCISPWDRVNICFRFWVISISGLYMMVFSEVGNVDASGSAWEYCRSRRDHVDVVFRRQIITTSGFWPPYWISGRNVSGEVSL